MRRDLTQYRLPFIDDNDCGLGIAVRTYLDDLPLQADPTSPEARAEVKSKGKEWFQHSDSFTGNLDMAFKLWDAVSTTQQSFLRPLTHLLPRYTAVRRARARNLRRASNGKMQTAGWPSGGKGLV